MKKKLVLLSLGAMLTSEAVYAAAQSSSDFAPETRKRSRDQENEQMDVVKGARTTNATAASTPSFNGDKYYEEAMRLVGEKKYQEAFKQLKLADICNHAEAQFFLSGIYCEESDVEKYDPVSVRADLREISNSFLSRAANNGHKESISQLWSIVMPNDRDVHGEIKWSARGARDGDAEAFENLVIIIQNEYDDEGCEKEKPYAQYELGKLCFDGVGCDKDIKRAFELMAESCRLGNREAFNFIRQHLADAERVAQSSVNGNMWHILACAYSKLNEEKAYNYSRRAANIAREQNDNNLYLVCVRFQYEAMIQMVNKFSTLKKLPKNPSFDEFKMLESTPDFSTLVEHLKKSVR